MRRPCSAVRAMTSRSFPRGMNRNEESSTPSNSRPRPPSEKKKMAKGRRRCFIRRPDDSATLRPLIFCPESFVRKTPPFRARVDRSVHRQMPRISVLVANLAQYIPEDGEEIHDRFIHQIS